ncbi:MAG: bifunctional RNase H/acid phosphatase [Mycobacteriales bacterium]
MSRRVVIEADGGSRGNPGPAGFGALVRDAVTGQVLAECSESIGVATNNVAEYRGLIAGLTAAAALDPLPDHVEVRMDSKLVVEQMSGHWQVRHPAMRPLARQASALLARFPSKSLQWVPRARNAAADRLANAAMDAAARPAAARPAAPEPVTSAPRLPGWMAATAPPTTTLLLRHGETALSVDRRFCGSSDPPLSERGERQAAAAAAALSRRPGLTAVVTSPLERARRTAEAVGAALGVSVTEDADLRETDFGAWEGFTFAEVGERWSRELAAWLADPAVAPPGGETFLATERRVVAACVRALDAFAGQGVVLVSHVSPIKTLTRHALLAPPEALYRLHLDLCSVTTVDWYADGPAVLRGFNDTGHLSGEDR